MDGSRTFFQTLQKVTTAAALTGCVYAASSFAQTAIPPLAWDSMAIGATPPNFEFQRTGEGIRGRSTEGDRFTILFNGRPPFTAMDRTMPGPGKIALWTKRTASRASIDR